MTNQLLFDVANGTTPALKDDAAIASNTDLALQLQSRLKNFWLIDNPDGVWGPHSAKALSNFKQFRKIDEPGFGPVTAKALVNTDPHNLIDGFKLNGDWASRTIMWMTLHGQHISTGTGEINIVYFRGLDKDGHWNGDNNFVFNDRRTVLVVKDGTPTFLGNWLCTTEPGEYYWDHPLNDEGCAVLKVGQYQAWSIGSHHQQYPCLVQSGTITVLRGRNKTPDTGSDFAVNQHTTSNDHDDDSYSVGDPVGRWSAGCQVGAAASEHYKQFMPLVMSDPREKAAKGEYKHWTTLIPGNEFLDMFPV